jgi:hypothetical protein
MQCHSPDASHYLTSQRITPLKQNVPYVKKSFEEKKVNHLKKIGNIYKVSRNYYGSANSHVSSIRNSADHSKEIL